MTTGLQSAGMYDVRGIWGCGRRVPRQFGDDARRRMPIPFESTSASGSIASDEQIHVEV
ncbi:hypothetical protein [Burkholderia cepacia]|uniref:hypothetical protein n=1 Tax=Burkholderia cepacia TaxID=292 RepID=UPI003D672C4B